MDAPQVSFKIVPRLLILAQFSPKPLIIPKDTAEHPLRSGHASILMNQAHLFKSIIFIIMERI